MQRYRINYNWLIGVFVVGLVVAIAAFFMQRWQVSRKAGYFITRAEAAAAEDDHLAAFRAYNHYLQLRPDEDDIRIKMAKAGIDVIRSATAERKDQQRAFGVLDATVRTTGDPELRRTLAEFYLASKREREAAELLEELLETDPDNPEVNTMFVQALYASSEYSKLRDKAFDLIGYDGETDKFDRTKVNLTGATDVYALLAQVLVDEYKQEEMAQRVIEEMIAAAPEEALTHLRKSLFLSKIKDKEGARESLQKAYEIDPKDEMVLSRKSREALSDAFVRKTDSEELQTEAEIEAAAQKKKEFLELAKTYLVTGQKEYPKSRYFYRMLAQVENLLGNYDAALAVLDLGIAKLDKDVTIEIGLYKIDVLLGNDDYEGVLAEIKRLENLNRLDMASLLEFQHARIKYNKNEWLEVTQDLKRLVPLLPRGAIYRRPTVNPTNYQLMCRLMLASSYMQQGINDVALQTYTAVLEDYPENTVAQKGFERLSRKKRPDQGLVALDRLIDKTLELPEAEQDWGKMEEVLEQVIAKNGLNQAHQKLLRAKIYVKRGLYDEAKSLIRQAAKDAPDDINVHFTAILLVTSNPKQGPEVGLRLLNNLEKKWGVSLKSIAQRASLIALQNSDQVVEELLALLDDTGNLTQSEILRLRKVIGQKLEQAGKLDEALELTWEIAELEPNSLPIRMHLFMLALRNRNDAEMQKAQKAILDFVKNPKDAHYLLTEARRVLANIDSRDISSSEREELIEVLKKLDIALLERPDWHELHITYGQILLTLKKDRKLALEHFELALEHGPARTGVTAILVNQLEKAGLYKEARERMELLTLKQQTELLGLTQVKILMETGDKELGFTIVKKMAERDPGNPALQLEVSKIAQQMDDLSFATQAVRDSLKEDSSSPDKWIRLIGLYTEQKKFGEIEQVMREAHLACDAEYLPLLTGKYYEMQSRWQNAESMYLAAYDHRLDDLSVLHRVGNFYLFWSSKDETYVDKAAIYINRLLRAANEGKAASDNPHVAWARIKAAQILFLKKDYQQSLLAERLLRETDADYVMNHEETELLSDILIARADPQSLLTAKELLLSLRKEDRLPKKSALQLVHILSQSGQWDEAKRLLLELVIAYPGDAAIWVTYVDLFIDHGEYSSADKGLKKLQSLDPQHPSLVQLSIRLVSEKGNQVRAKQMLASLVPGKDLRGALSQTELKQVFSVAQLATRFEDFDLAEKLYDAYANRVPAGVFELAKFHAYHGDIERALTLMKEGYSARTDDTIQLANRMLSARHGEISEASNKQIDRLIDAGLREDPDSVTRQLARAEAYESQGLHEKSIAVYDQLLARDDLTTRLRAGARNNLGFQLGLLNQRVDEAELLVTQAMEALGPLEDVLDTRAVVRTMQKKYDLAIEDMLLATSVSQDPIKFFHLAKAYVLAGNQAEAAKAWEKAQGLGFEKENLPILEQANFDEIVKQIEKP